MYSPGSERKDAKFGDVVVNNRVRSGYVANNSMYEAVFLEHRGVANMKAAQAPRSPTCDWSDLQNENKYNEGSEPVAVLKGVHTYTRTDIRARGHAHANTRSQKVTILSLLGGKKNLFHCNCVDHNYVCKRPEIQTSHP